MSLRMSLFDWTDPAMEGQLVSIEFLETRSAKTVTESIKEVDNDQEMEI